jgi:hypothetical protein
MNDDDHIETMFKQQQIMNGCEVPTRINLQRGETNGEEMAR